jgi:hypothetical protein
MLRFPASIKRLILLDVATGFIGFFDSPSLSAGFLTCNGKE